MGQSAGPGHGWSRRRFLGLGAAVGSAVLLSACGESADDDAPPATGSGGTFPATVTDKFGMVTIPAQPKTIASVGRTDHDVLVALGLVPASVYQFVPTMKRGVGVWAESKLGSANPEILTFPVSLEKIAALRPDLILNVQSNGDEAEYRKMTEIAPTVGLPPNTGPNAVTWQESVRVISTAVGRAADGDKLVADTEAILTKAKNDNPTFAGKTITILLGTAGKLGIFTTADTRTRVATALGLTPSAYVAGLGESTFFTDLSNELVNDGDADVVLLLTREGLNRADALAQYPALAASKAATADRLAVVEDFDVSLALAAGSVLSIPYAVEGLVPLLKTVLR
ncbi:iron ABC transporter [Micromonospora echinospora]|uniref:Iron complex transport system substrate-binding protein n=1 Tax=Micromonospora echinospora TaxID=1877 RepID=A0A1C4ZIW9_MICEC|nr:ABC transporter substrate-binding protein [Micromonospora echinospora]OZV77030.1 iron ABC transporter [Micromonospora echinospora]SCF32963.1 iron complex transport system substrate-binding protein [Micromonospora echinospora]